MDTRYDVSRRAVRIAIWTFAFVVFGLSIYGGMLRSAVRRNIKEDLQDSPIQHGIARIEAINGPDRAQVGRQNHPWALVRFQGKLYSANIPVRADIAVGKEAGISYKQGKSGRILVLGIDGPDDDIAVPPQ